MDIKALVPLAIIFVVIAIVVSLGATILGNLREGQEEGELPYNATTKGLESLGSVSDYLPTIAMVVVVGVIVGIIVSFLMPRAS